MPTFDNPFEGSGSSALPLAKIDSIRGALLCSMAVPGQPRQWESIVIGTRVVLDWGVRFYGGISFSPTVTERVVLDGQPPPEIPQDGREWQLVIKLPMLIEGRGLFMGSYTGKISQNRVRALRQLFDLCPEAQRGLLQEYVLRGFDQVPLDKGTFYGFVLQPDGWIERDIDTFGPRLIPPPPPMVASPAVSPRLSGSNGGAVANAPIPVAANDPSPPSRESQSPAPTPVANDTGPLARYRPAPSGAGRKPY
jgi:hypothetical protein